MLSNWAASVVGAPLSSLAPRVALLALVSTETSRIGRPHLARNSRRNSVRVSEAPNGSFSGAYHPHIFTSWTIAPACRVCVSPCLDYCRTEHYNRGAAIDKPRARVLSAPRNTELRGPCWRTAVEYSMVAAADEARGRSSTSVAEQDQLHHRNFASCICQIGFPTYSNTRLSAPIRLSFHCLGLRRAPHVWGGELPSTLPGIERFPVRKTFRIRSSAGNNCKSEKYCKYCN